MCVEHSLDDWIWNFSGFWIMMMVNMKMEKKINKNMCMYMDIYNEDKWVNVLSFSELFYSRWMFVTLFELKLCVQFSWWKWRWWGEASRKILRLIYISFYALFKCYLIFKIKKNQASNILKKIVNYFSEKMLEFLFFFIRV